MEPRTREDMSANALRSRSDIFNDFSYVDTQLNSIKEQLRDSLKKGVPNSARCPRPSSVTVNEEIMDHETETIKLGFTPSTYMEKISLNKRGPTSNITIDRQSNSTPEQVMLQSLIPAMTEPDPCIYERVAGNSE